MLARGSGTALAGLRDATARRRGISQRVRGSRPVAEYAMEPFETVQMLGRWPVVLPAYRVEHCRVQPNWEEGRLLSMHAHLRPGDVLYDVGSEHGDLSALYATWVTEVQQGDVYVVKDGAGTQVGSEIREPNLQRGGVVLVEGSDKFWPVIKATFEANGLVPVGCYAGFASDIDSPEEFRTPSWSEPKLTTGGAWPGWATEFEAAAFHGFKSLVESKQTIPNMRFDTMAETFGPPDALTVDVEGAEGRVLRGSERILREHRPLVWTSVHEALLWFDYPEWPGMTTEEVLPWFHEFMADFGYRSQHIETNHETHVVSWPEEREDFDPWLGIEHLRP